MWNMFILRGPRHFDVQIVIHVDWEHVLMKQWKVWCAAQWIKLSEGHCRKTVSLKGKMINKVFISLGIHKKINYVCSLTFIKIPGGWWFGRCRFPSSWFDRRSPGSAGRLFPIGCWEWGCPRYGSVTGWWNQELKCDWPVPGGWWAGHGPKVL